MGEISRKMAKFAHNLQIEDVPVDAIKEAKRFLIDSVGCSLAALKNEDMIAMMRFTRNLGGVVEATIIGYGERTNAPNAALMNCLRSIPVFIINATLSSRYVWRVGPHPVSNWQGAVQVPSGYP